jgi:hypothetical protein
MVFATYINTARKYRHEHKNYLTYKSDVRKFERKMYSNSIKVFSK